MKRSILLFPLLLVFSSLLIGQSYQKGQLTISPTYGVRSPGSIATGNRIGIRTIPSVLYVDYGISEQISVGAVGGLRIVQCDNCPDRQSGTFVSLGVRVNGHIFPILKKFAEIEVESEKIDPYLSLMGGAELNSSISMVPRIMAGVRYKIHPKIALMGEIGTGFLSMINIGATFHLR